MGETYLIMAAVELALTYVDEGLIRKYLPNSLAPYVAVIEEAAKDTGIITAARYS